MKTSYFKVTRVQSGSRRMEGNHVFCPTKQMFAEFFTKALQGILFRRLCATIMGHADADSLKDFTTRAPQERVELTVCLERVSEENGDTIVVIPSDKVDCKLDIVDVINVKPTYANIVRSQAEETPGRSNQKVKFKQIERQAKLE